MSLSLRNFSESVVRQLSGAGFRAVFAGGCVRDQLLGKEPHDYDVATSARPEDVLKLFPRALPVGMAFGVVRVLDAGEDPQQVEVATFRARRRTAMAGIPTTFASPTKRKTCAAVISR